MVVSHLLSPLRTLKTRAAAGGRRGSSGSNDGWSDGPDDAAAAAATGNGSSSIKATGQCVCCGSRVTYPAGAGCFRCTVCDTVNDLAAVGRTEKVVGEDGQAVQRACRAPPPLTLGRLRAGVQAYRRHPEKHGLLEAMLFESFGNWDVLNASFPSGGSSVSADDPAIALADVHAAYATILALPAPFIRAMMSGTEQVLRRPGRPLAGHEDIRYLAIILENPLLLQQSFPQEASYHHHIVKSIVGTVANLPGPVHYALVLWLAQHSRASLKRKTVLVNQFIAYRVQKYDRARRRDPRRPGPHHLPLTAAYTAQSCQTELPAFRRQRSSTNAPLHSDHLRLAAGATRHARGRSNTDSCIALVAHGPSPLSAPPGITPPDPDREMDPDPEPPCRQSSTNPFYARAQAAQAAQQQQQAAAPARSGLGIGGARAPVARFVSLGVSSPRRPSAKEKGLARIGGGVEWPFRRVPKAPAVSAAATVTPRTSYFVQLRADGPGPDPDPASDGARLRATSLAASSADLRAALGPAVDKENGPADAVRPARGSVLGVLDGTAEPSSPSRSSLARARSSSEAPARRQQRQQQQQLARQMPRRLADGVPPQPQMGDGPDDFYLGADGLLYPKARSLVLHQHDWRLVAAAKVMALLHAANLLLSARARLRVDEFYNPAVDSMDLVADYDAWQARVPGAFSFCQYPFLLSLQAKVQIMQVDAARQMDSKVTEAVISALFQSHRARLPQWTPQQPHLKLLVRRRCLVEDSLHQLATREQDLKKRLKIEFVDEEGVDAGGLTKEWFMLLVRELMNPVYGMFARDPDATAFWFSPASLESSNQYFLVGVVVGLALYNSVILDLRLPLAVFKKLLRAACYHLPPAPAARPAGAAALVSGTRAPPTATAAEAHAPVYGLLSPSAQLRYQINEMLTDVAEFRPQLARGLHCLLQYRADDVEDVFGLAFEASYDAHGEVVTVPLVPNGGAIAVTSGNRIEYVVRYLQWVLNDAVAKQFDPFRRGFYYVCGGNALALFRPEEIELMVHGSGADWTPQELRALAEYMGFGPDPDAHPIVAWFWAALADMRPADRRRLLSFATGTDRMPMFAADRMCFKLALLGPDHDRLPVAHTCFNQLGLWSYRSQSELQAKLLLAIHESEGFGLR
ncbi:putative E3 ubiquitin-protein ligase [Coemansia spiralis]|nr:putative E3 ubiquitin-protein ligase [Coemansia spiralis]